MMRDITSKSPGGGLDIPPYSGLIMESRGGLPFPLRETHGTVGASALTASGRKLAGYVATFNTPARIDGFYETIRPGAFRESLTRDILAMADHDPKMVLGRTKSGSLRLWEDLKGLAFELDLPDTSAARDLLALAERGDLGGCSFGFSVPKGGEKRTGATRELTRVDLYEISIVKAWPAYSGTSVEARTKAPRLAQARRYLETVGKAPLTHRQRLDKYLEECDALFSTEK